MTMQCGTVTHQDMETAVGCGVTRENGADGGEEMGV